MLGARPTSCRGFGQTASVHSHDTPYPGAVSVSCPGGPASSIDGIAASILADLRAATPDVGDDRVQVVLDDVLDRFEDRLAALTRPKTDVAADAACADTSVDESTGGAT